MRENSNLSIPKNKAMGNANIGTVAIKIERTPPGKYDAAIKEAELGNIVPIKAMTQNICREFLARDSLFFKKICLKPNKTMTMKNCQKIIPK